jgi:hypothetical protein
MTNIICYENIIFYNGNFYIDKINIKTTYLHNRDKFFNYEFTPFDIDLINLPESPIIINETVLLLDHFHWNPAHNLWDHVYPSWYGLFHYFNKNSENIDFKWITKTNLNDIHVKTHQSIIEKFSGSCLDSLESFTNKYKRPLLISRLITGLYGIGISHINKNDLTVIKELNINDIDSIEIFVNRMYFKYNIKRNSLLIENDFNKCNNIIFIKNKRPYNGIEELFNKMSKKYEEKYNFKIIDYSEYSFQEQLEILNKTCLCIVGVGSARFNTPFLPNGSIEIQVFQPNINRKNYIEYVDYHGGTLSKNVKIKNIPYYTEEESKNYLYSNLLETYIDEALLEIPCKVPVNLEENIPLEIRNLKNNINYSIMFDKWKSTKSNILEDFIDIL